MKEGTLSLVGELLSTGTDKGMIEYAILCAGDLSDSYSIDTDLTPLTIVNFPKARLLSQYFMISSYEF